MTSLTPSPLQANVVETQWNVTNITGVKYYYTTGSTSSNNISLNLASGQTNVTGFHDGISRGFQNITLNVSWTFNYVNPPVVNFSGVGAGAFANFSDTHQQPGVHSITFCANDTANNVNCSIASTYNILVANATAVIEHYNLNNSGVRILDVINSEAGAGLATTDLMLLNAKGNSNYTLAFNRSGPITATVVGATFDNSSILNITNFNLTVVPSPNWVTNLSSIGYNVTIREGVANVNTTAWLDIPSDVLTADYKYVQFRFASVGEYDGYFYCNGTAAAATAACYKIQSRCNDLAINYSTQNLTIRGAGGPIPPGGCYSSTGGVSANVTIYTWSASGVAMANDTFAPSSIVNNTRTGFRSQTMIINVTVTDRNGGTGINTTIYFRWQNASDSGTGDLRAMSNTTAVGDNIFNATFNTATLSDGLYTLIINATDNAIVPNRNDSFSFGLLRVDNTAPINASAVPFPSAGANFDNFTAPLSIVWNDTFWNATNVNATVAYVDSSANMTLNVSGANIMQSAAGAAFNVSMRHNFSSTNTNPGPHTVYYFANDTIGNARTISNTFVIRVANASQVKSTYEEALNGITGTTINLTREVSTGTGTPINDDNLLSVRGTYNYSMAVNRTTISYLTVFGLTVNETNINNIDNGNNLTIATNANWTTNLSSYGFNAAKGDLLWMDLNASFVNATDFKFGRMDFTTWHDGYFYCNNTWNAPNCYRVDPCGSRPDVTNYSAVIPNGTGGCFVRSGNAATLYTLRLSGGIAANDTLAPRITVNVPLAGSSLNKSIGFNITVLDVNGGTGVNASRVQWRYENSSTNGSWYNLTNTSTAAEFTFTVNTTLILDGNYTIRFNASDAAANANENSSVVVTGVVFDYTSPTCTITQLKTDTITVGEALTSSDFSCATGDNIGIDATRTNMGGLDTTSAATRNAKCNIFDTANNTGSCTVAYTVYTGGSGGGGGGGGGGGSIGESSSVIVVGDLTAGQSKSVTGFDSKSGVEQVTVETTQLVSDAKVTVSTLSDKPSSISASPEGRVYKYIEIKIPEIPSDSAVNKAEIAFKVEKKWLVDNSLDINSVRLARFHADSWQKLTTTLSKQDSTHAYYHAETPGFSTFAVVAEKTVTGAPAVEPEKETTTTTTTAVIPKAGKQPVDQKAVGVIALLILVAVIAYFVTQQKKSGSVGKWRRK